VHTQFSRRKLKGTDHLEDVEVDKRVLLKGKSEVVPVLN